MARSASAALFGLTFMGATVVALACTVGGHGLPLHGAEPVEKTSHEGEYWIGPAVSGTWFSADRVGEGLALQMLEDGSVFVVWFTYPAAGEPGEQAWLLGLSSDIDGDSIRFEQVVRPQGARFGEAFDPAQVQNTPWGRIELSFHDCANATLRFQGPGAFGAGERELLRLTHPDQLGCDGVRDLLPNGGRAASGLRAKSGSWFVPSRSGEGWLVEELPGGLTGVYWFTYDEEGRQRWIFGTGAREGDRVVLDDSFLTRGTRFGSGFDPAAVELVPFGRVQLDFSGCTALALGYQSELGNATRQAVQLTRVAGLPCLDNLPAETGGGSWSERAPIPGGRQSELAVAKLGEHFYALGGFGDLTGFKRYTPASNSWTVLPAMPEGRHHLAAFAIDGGVYFVGGAPASTLGGVQLDQPAYRFDLATGQWQPVAGLLATYGAHATLLHGRIYVAFADGSLQEFDARTGRIRLIAPPAEYVERDHSQLVAFLDEIWMLGGRFPETHRVAIYNPASGTWREGPGLSAVRAGFAAAVVGARIVAAGGELIGNPASLVDSAESYAAGASRWTALPSPPVAVHGVDGVGFDGRFYLVGGSTVPGATIGATGRLFALDLDD